jgi:23S rRNA (guanosine2251-2'-O)-methyltransferase
MGNIGQIFRTAYTLGVDAIILSGLKQFALEKAAKPSSGAIYEIKLIEYPNPLDALNELKLAGFKLIAADAKGEDIRKLSFSGKRALILGSEHDGIPSRVIEKCDKTVSIVMDQDFDSLNVSAAAAILIDRIRE